jgi:YVTN family beta-propeller protein
MGAVYRAEPLGLRRKVALKILAPELARDRRFRERFLRESQLAASLDHPHVIPIYDAGEAEDLLYIAMRYVDGKDLRTLIDQGGALETERAVRLVAQVADALDVAHVQGLVHRDVKPGNILLAQRADTPQHAYLCDFGLSKMVSSISGLTATGQFLGTVDYVAPEQIKGEALDGRADLYSLACVLYECLAGVPPYRRDTEVATLWAHMQEPPPPVTAGRPGLPPRLDDVLARALAKDPDERFPTCGHFAAAARGDDEAAAPRVALRPRVPPRSLRRRGKALAWPWWRWGRRRLGALGVIVAAAAAAIAVVAVRGGSNDGGIVPLPPNSLGIIDPASNEVVGQIPVGTDPGAVAVGEEAVWVANVEDQTVSKINPGTREVEKTIGLGFAPESVAAGHGAVWVADADGGNVAKIAPFTGGVEETIDVGAGGKGSIPLALGRDAVWVANENDFVVRRIAPDTERTVATIKEVQSPRAISAAGSDVWVIEYVDEVVSRIDTKANRLAERVPIGERPTTVAVGSGSLWVGEAQENTVWRIDATTHALVKTISVGEDPDAIAIGAGSVWVANSRDGTVSRIDPISNEVVATIDVGAQVDGIAVGAGSVWVTVG